MPKLEKNIVSIQALRGIAAILVVFCHSEQYISAFLNVKVERFVGNCFGGFGVDIFFVISGFIMVYICRNEFGQKNALGTFLRRRILRIFPMYWITILIVLALIVPTGIYAYALPVDKQCVVSSSVDVFRNLLLIPSFSPKGECPIVGVSWTLLFEMFFYYSFALLLIFHEKIYLPALCFIFTSLILTSLCINDFHVHNGFTSYFAFLGNDIILEFIFGCFLAEQFLAGHVLTYIIAGLVILFSIMAILLSYHGTFIDISPIRAVRWGIPSAFIVFGLLSLEANGAIKIPKALIKLGDSSYSIYLTHLSIYLMLIIVALKQAKNYMHISGDIAVFAAWAACVLLGYLTYQYVEKPVTKWLKKFNATNATKERFPAIPVLSKQNDNQDAQAPSTL